MDPEVAKDNNSCFQLEDAAKPGEQVPYTPDPAAERRLVRKLDRTILPWIMLLYLLSYIDSNMGNARNIGLEKDIHLSSEQYQLASASFYIGTVVFGTIGGLMLKVVKPSIWLGAATTNGAGLAAVRFFLGVFEASFAPGCALYLSFWYLKSELSLRIAAYAGMSALSGVLSGVIAYCVGRAQSLAVEPWQALFIIEGLPTGMRASAQDDFKYHGRDAFTDYRLYLFCIIYSGLSLSLAVAAVFLPTIVKDLGYHSVTANLMTAPVYATAYVILIITATLSDRYRVRGIPIMVGGIMAGIGYILLGLLSHDTARYISCFFAVTAGVGLGIVIAVTHAVGVAASNIYPKSDAPYYVMGSSVSSALTFSTAVGAALMSFLLYKENCRRDRIYGKPEQGLTIDMGGDADKAADYRYDI
ncbi:hypothetical protein NLU13_5050 [Sarocladium strictum]|uniref:Major facilitator superfamily (MFS) profile domain-containing protein n=1 Tax=Sarocladium strictum TaxID=5046 RepID=A0AA39GK24_SARSR|nr:hypothetical protein NLU13_5050 [Sarocladium strictum]